MKRSQLRRSTKPMKRSRLKPQSKKRAKQNRMIQPIREAFKAELGCPCGRAATDTHEIHGGASRFLTVNEREAWIALCREHHEEVQDWSDKEYQYALKKLTDPAFYDRVTLNRLARWADEAISEAEVEAVLPDVQAWIREIKR